MGLFGRKHLPTVTPETRAAWAARRSPPAKPTTRQIMTATGGHSNRPSMPTCEDCGAERPLTVHRNRAVCLGGCP